MSINAVNDLLLDEMVMNLSNLASVYYKPVSLVSRKFPEIYRPNDDDDAEPEQQLQSVVQEAAKALGSDVGILLDLDFGVPASNDKKDTSHHRGSTIEEMLGSVEAEEFPIPFTGSPANGALPNLYPLQPGFSFPKTTFLSSADCNGLSVEGTFFRKLGKVYMDMRFENKSSTPISGFAIQFNVNS